jgi:hypothetical protein
MFMMLSHLFESTIIPTITKIIKFSVQDASRSKKPGFLPGLKALIQYFRKKTRFLATRECLR